MASPGDGPRCNSCSEAVETAGLKARMPKEAVCGRQTLDAESSSRVCCAEMNVKRIN